MDPSQFTRLSHHEHVLARPGLYIGSMVPETVGTYVYDLAANKIVPRDVSYAPGLLKIILEVMNNASDHVPRLLDMAASNPAIKTTKKITIAVQDDGAITVRNDGTSLPLATHEESGLPLTELVFGTLLTSSNFDDTVERTVAGTYGIGVKACNIFSKRFRVTTVDDVARKSYTQEWTNNMRDKARAVVAACTRNPYTEVHFVPDYARFGCTGPSPELVQLLARYACDMAAMVGVDVHFNGERIPVKTFPKYVDLYVGQESRYPAVVSDRMEIVVTPSDGFKHVSFVNGIYVSRGGRHVDVVVDAITRDLCALVEQKKKCRLKPSHLRESMMVFVRATIPNPTFDGQTKELLTTPYKDFGYKIELPKAFLDKLCASDIVSRAMAAHARDQDRQISKTDGRKSARLTGISKLEDATNAGTKRSAECTLILTEGDSAKSSVIAGLKSVGRDLYGVFPLRGKPLNALGASQEQLAQNEELTSIKKILGLSSGKKYDGTGELRYGRVMIVSDQDYDGFHIRGLVMNLFNALWPSLLRPSGFLCALQTPIVKARRGERELCFYSMADHQRWARDAEPGWTIKFYKGLGTSSAAEARAWFEAPMRVTTYEMADKEDEDSLDMAFNKKRSGDRKRWLENFDAEAVHEQRPVLRYSEFVDAELASFSNYAVMRTVPSVVDGLKPSQRKILFGCFKKGLTSELKVVQLAGYIGEAACYHHGDDSLHGAIVGMAQDFVGSNNANLLEPRGQFGTRIQGGKDAASPRYINTRLDAIAFAAFNPLDADVLSYLDDDGQSVEPVFYVPVVPMVLINGATGIGTGFSTDVPCYDPMEVAGVLRAYLQTGEISAGHMRPWYRGFRGSVEPVEKGGYLARGVWERKAPCEVDVTELPIGRWSEEYKVRLEGKVADGILRDYRSAYTDTDVLFHLRFPSEDALEATIARGLDKEFGLVEGISVGNMHLYSPEGRVKKYADVGSIFADFVAVREATYAARKDFLLAKLRREALLAAERARFVGEVAASRLDVFVGRPKLEEALDAGGYVRVDGGFDHLCKMPVQSLTADRRADLELKAASALEELAALDATTVPEMWRRDLDAFERAWEDHMTRFEAKSGGARGEPAKKSTRRPAKKARV